MQDISHRKKWFSTGDVERITGFSQSMIIRLIDEGILPGIRIPGSTHRRVLRNVLVNFCRDNGVPFEKEESK